MHHTFFVSREKKLSEDGQGTRRNNVRVVYFVAAQRPYRVNGELGHWRRASFAKSFDESGNGTGIAQSLEVLIVKGPALERAAGPALRLRIARRRQLLCHLGDDIDRYRHPRREVKCGRGRPQEFSRWSDATESDRLT